MLISLRFISFRFHSIPFRFALLFFSSSSSSCTTFGFRGGLNSPGEIGALTAAGQSARARPVATSNYDAAAVVAAAAAAAPSTVQLMVPLDGLGRARCT